ncbi:MAG TPA: hypothetical protein IAB65_06370 [Candidatus Onthocola stercorigallinarum]|nr:hypothetical protein [Candidatus Onthocola stercorigallinarum]
MSEEKLNEQYIKDHIQGICQDCIYLDKIVPIIRETLSEAYINGLEQGKFDRQMLELAVQKYKEILEENQKYKELIDKAIKYYESNQQECVIGRNKDEKLIKEYYLPAQCSKKMLDILKEVE